MSCKFLHKITKNTDIELIAKLDLSNGVSKNSINNILQLSSTAYLVCSNYGLSIINLTPELNISIIKKPLSKNIFTFCASVNSKP